MGKKIISQNSLNITGKNIKQIRKDKKIGFMRKNAGFRL